MARPRHAATTAAASALNELARGMARMIAETMVIERATTDARPQHTHRHDAKGFVREVEHVSEERGLRLTPLRMEVLELIAAATKPVKAYDLLDQLREKHGNAAPPTVYRALDFLLEQRFIHKLESINAYVSCHHPAQAHQVPFLICDVCSSAEEVCDPRVAELIDAQARALGFRAQAQTLEVHGICKRCQKS